MCQSLSCQDGADERACASAVPGPPVYQAFRQRGDPPPGSRVLLGFYSSSGVLPNTRLRFREPTPGTVPAGKVEFLPFTAIIGQLVVVFCLPVHGPPVRTIAEAQGALIEIWPPTGAPVNWPPSIGLDAADVGVASLWELA